MTAPVTARSSADLIHAEALAERLAGHGYVPVPVDLSEFHKAGGGIKCCTQEIR